MIQDLSGLGKCSLTAAIPVISVMGVQAVPLPTAVLSNQTGYPSYYLDDYTDRMGQIMDEWEKRKFMPDGIYTGFLAGEKQADQIQAFFQRFRREDTMVLVDPVMGDNGAAYGIYTEGLRKKMIQIATGATVITPNITEALLLLYGKEEMERRYADLMEMDCKPALDEAEKIGEELKEKLAVKYVVITGMVYDMRKSAAARNRVITAGPNDVQMVNLVIGGWQGFQRFTKKIGGSYSGTGDLFASVLAAGMVKSLPMEECVEKATVFLSKAIRDTVQEGTDRNDGICFEKYLGELMR